jgi:hypothetical protein
MFRLSLWHCSLCGEEFQIRSNNLACSFNAPHGRHFSSMSRCIAFVSSLRQPEGETDGSECGHQDGWAKPDSHMLKTGIVHGLMHAWDNPPSFSLVAATFTPAAKHAIPSSGASPKSKKDIGDRGRGSRTLVFQSLASGRI